MDTQTYTVTVDEEGNRFWYNNQNQLHRILGPAAEYANGFHVWWLNGQLHRTDGPAVEYADRYRAWWLNGQRHRADGPAVELANGHREWWLNGQRHRTLGPAVELANGHREWWVNGQELTEQEWQVRVNAEPHLLAEIEKLYSAAMRGRHKMSEELLAVTAQRDALLEALCELLTDAEFLGWDTAKARAAIKQAEGEES